MVEFLAAKATPIVSFIVVLGLVVIFHEFGHFIVSKWAGIPVYVFAVGFGPTLFKFRLRDTTYRVNLIPLGGYVHIAGIDPEEEDHPEGFHSKRVRWRIAVLSAGGVMNVVLGFLMFTLVGTIWGVATGVTSKIARVIPDKPAAKAGLQPGDRIVGAAAVGEELEQTSDVAKIRGRIAAHPGAAVRLLVQRGEEEWRVTVGVMAVEELVLLEEAEPGAEAAGRVRLLEFVDGRFRVTEVKLARHTIGRIGILFEAHQERIGIWESVRSGVVATLVTVGNILLGLEATIRGQVPLSESLRGPVGIASMAAHEAEVHWRNFLGLMGMISVSLAILNLLPFPALDGARILFLLTEVVLRWFRRPPLDRRKEAYVHMAGFVILVLLLVVLTYNDILRLLGR